MSITTNNAMEFMSTAWEIESKVLQSMLQDMIDHVHGRGDERDREEPIAPVPYPTSYINTHDSMYLAII